MARVAGAAEPIYRFFRQRGLSPQASAGIIGNTQQESGNDPNAPGGGLIQGQGGRTSSGTLQQQLEGVWRELSGPERGTLQALRGAKGPREAARIFSQRFERPGIPMLGNRERYAQEALKQFAGLGGAEGGGAPAVPGAGPGGGVATTPAQIEDLMQLVDSLKPSGPSTSVEGLAVPHPAEGGGVKVPSEVAQEPPVAPSSLLDLIGKIGQDAGTGEAPSAVGLPARPGAASGGGYVNPLPGFKLGRTDMGVDANAAPGTPIKAMGDAKVLGVAPDWYAGQPYVYYELLNGPRRGQVIYVAEQITPSVKAGDRVRAGQAIGHYAPSGTGIETGIGTHGWQTKAQAEGRTGDASHGNAPAGVQYRRILEALGAH